MEDRAAEFVVYVCDIGSIRKNNFAWVRSIQQLAGTDFESFNEGTDIDECVTSIKNDLINGMAIAIGLECPLFIPIPLQKRELGKARDNETIAWSASPAACVAMTGLQQLAYILKQTSEYWIDLSVDVKQWLANPQSKTILVWEAMVSSKAKGKKQKKESVGKKKKAHNKNKHIADAKAAFEAFRAKVKSSDFETDVGGEGVEKVSVFSLVAATAHWAKGNNQLLHTPLFVVKTEKPN
jgi:hypothetical protein